MTARQSQIVDFVRQFTGDNGYSPSYQEIATHLGVKSLSTVHKHIHIMENFGIVKLSGSGTRRTIEVVHGAQKNCSECAALRRELKDALDAIDRMRARRDI